MILSFFVEMAWKSALVAGAALLLVTLLRRRSAADRAAVLAVGAALLLLLPIVALFLPTLTIETPVAGPGAEPIVGTLLIVPEMAQQASLAPASGVAMAAPNTWADTGALLLLLYFGGLSIAALRLIAGIWTLRRWTVSAEPLDCPEWQQAKTSLSEAAGRPDVEVLVSGDACAPLSWGWRKPVILIDPDSYRRAHDAEAILAHEIAHVVRRDWPALMLARAAAALFWFNPLARLLERSFVRNAEEAADSRALERVEPIHYAQALLGCAEHRPARLLAANSIAASDLGQRVKAVLDGRGRGISSGARATMAAIAVCVAGGIPIAAVKLIPAAAAKAAPIAEAPAPAPVATPPAPAPAPAPAPVATASKSATPAPMRAAASPKAAAKPQRLEAVAAAIAPVADPAPQSAVRFARLSDEARLERLEQEAERAGQEAARAAREAARTAHLAAAEARRHANRQMAKGAEDMERGAEDMKRGARRMAEEAVKLRDPAYRERQIREQARQGRTVTHQQLIDAIPRLESGSEDMLRGAERMRQGAERMRRGS